MHTPKSRPFCPNPDSKDQPGQASSLIPAPATQQTLVNACWVLAIEKQMGSWGREVTTPAPQACAMCLRAREVRPPSTDTSSNSSFLKKEKWIFLGLSKTLRQQLSIYLNLSYNKTRCGGLKIRKIHKASWSQRQPSLFNGVACKSSNVTVLRLILFLQLKNTLQWFQYNSNVF